MDQVMYIFHENKERDIMHLTVMYKHIQLNHYMINGNMIIEKMEYRIFYSVGFQPGFML